MFTLIILHGWGQDRSVWHKFAADFDAANAIAWDLPGFGAEPLVSEDWGVPDYATWVVNKIESQKLENVVLCGHSFGGRISSYIAAQHPAWLRGLILDGAPSIYRPSLDIKAKILLAKLMKRLGVKRRVIGNSELQNANSRGLGQIFRKVVNFDQTELLPKINVPTLLIWGEKDDIVPLRIAYEIQKLIPASQLKVIPGAGHHTYQHNPYLFYGTVKNFIESL